LYQKLVDLLKTKIRNYSVAVTKEHIEVFEKLLKSKAPKTRSEWLRYLRRALEDLGWELSAEKLQEYFAELMEESPNIAQHTAKALKLFIKYVIKDPNLYHSFKMPRAEAGFVAQPLTLEEVRAVAREIDWPPAKAYYALPAETSHNSFFHYSLLNSNEEALLFNLKIEHVSCEEKFFKCSSHTLILGESVPVVKKTIAIHPGVDQLIRKV